MWEKRDWNFKLIGSYGNPPSSLSLYSLSLSEGLVALWSWKTPRVEAFSHNPSVNSALVSNKIAEIKVWCQAWFPLFFLIGVMASSLPVFSHSMSPSRSLSLSHSIVFLAIPLSLPYTHSHKLISTTFSLFGSMKGAESNEWICSSCYNIQPATVWETMAVAYHGTLSTQTVTMVTLSVHSGKNS